MGKNFSLQPLLDLSNLRLDEATRQLGRLIAGEQEAHQRLALLVQYRDEYHARFLAAAGQGIGPDAWRNFQHFLGRLDEAIEQARTLVVNSQQRTAAGKQHWIDQRGKVKAFDTLSARHQAREATVEARQAQKLSDEHAARRFHAEPDDN